MNSLGYILMVSACYFFYHWHFFRYAENAAERKKPRYVVIFATFFINYLLFILCSYLELHLIVNWTIFGVFLCAEGKIFYRLPVRESCFFGGAGAMVGLAVNIFFRALVAILLDVPASIFDSRLITANLKRYPIAIGFVLTGAIFLAARRLHWDKKIRPVLRDQPSLRFLLRLMLPLCGYLCLNLLIFYTPGNSPMLKIWGIKSSVCVLVGFYIAMKYAARMSRLNLYREQNRRQRQELLAHTQEEIELRSIAYTDPLTGYYNRKHGDHRLADFVREGRRFCLCFADLNGLKTVNDSLGHLVGDRYIMLAADELHRVCDSQKDVFCRYGGDEFLVLFGGASCREVEQRLREAGRALERLSRTADCPFDLSFSYGLVDSGERGNAQDLLKEADARMYRNKLQRGTLR